MTLASIPSPARSAWHLGPLPIRAQAVCVAVGIILALVVAERRYRAAGGAPKVVLDVAAWAVPAGLIPAALVVLLAPVHSGPWQAVRTWGEVIGFPGAVALGAAAAWLACRRLSARAGPGPAASPDGMPRRIRLGPVAGAAAPAIAFGLAVAVTGNWIAQQGYGRPSSLPWAVAISPAHRPSGYENFATFQPMFLYQALLGIVTGLAVIWAGRRFALPGERVFALQAAAYAAGGFGLFWLGIGHLPVVLGLRAGELGDAVVLVGAAVYLARTRRMRNKPLQAAQKAVLERGSSVM
jgi:prolipoprotein diacylglyceryltransferase